MKKMGLILMAAMLASCSDGDGPKPDVGVLPPDGTVYTEHFIQAYIVPEQLEAAAWTDGYLRLELDGRDVRSTDQKVREEYAALSTKYGDTAFDGYLVPHSTAAIGTDCTAIDLVCDKAFDAAHEAGASLNDAVKICAVSFRGFIAGGYDRKSSAAEFPNEFAGL